MIDSSILYCSLYRYCALGTLNRKISVFDEQYKILEKTKDGWATSPEYNGRNLHFKTQNVLMVFANREPNRKELSQDRWIILKISKDLMELSDITDGSSGVKKKKKMDNESDVSDGGVEGYDWM